MSHDPPIVRREVEITNELGLHFRPAQKFVQLASQFKSEIRVHYNGKESNAKSFLDLTLLAAECGTRLDLVASGPDAEAAVEALVRLVVSRFDEGDDSQEKEPGP
jgi:phosphocarrier protein HPr